MINRPFLNRLHLSNHRFFHAFLLFLDNVKPSGHKRRYVLIAMQLLILQSSQLVFHLKLLGELLLCLLQMLL